MQFTINPNDPDDNILDFQITQAATNGSAQLDTLQGASSIATYTPSGTAGTDEFTVQVTDPGGLTGSVQIFLQNQAVATQSMVSVSYTGTTLVGALDISLNSPAGLTFDSCTLDLGNSGFGLLGNQTRVAGLWDTGTVGTVSIYNCDYDIDAGTPEPVPGDFSVTVNTASDLNGEDAAVDANDDFQIGVVNQ